MAGEKIPGVMPVHGELISVSRIAKAREIKDGTLDYTTPSGVQINANIEKGLPTKVKLFHQGKEIKIKGLPERPHISNSDRDDVRRKLSWEYVARLKNVECHLLVLQYWVCVGGVSEWEWPLIPCFYRNSAHWACFQI